ncbi:hypothetical protein [Nonomuraea sp. LPB2021202275-12-8]|uniref:hypothetical protein n=1 Tax=Nonomuraea sp. LPB2021202275-12-8 TaxID=3120159 RepID=UPI00300CFC82
MRKVTWLHRFGLVSAVVAAGLATTPVAAQADGYDCTPGTYGTFGIYTSPGGGTWVFRSTHEAMCVD